jgi:hypothetical protein
MRHRRRRNQDGVGVLPDEGSQMPPRCLLGSSLALTTGKRTPAMRDAAVRASRFVEVAASG